MVSKVFRIYTRHAGLLLSVAALVFLIDALVRLLAIDRPLVAALAGIVTLVLSTMYTGMVVELVSDVRDGRLDQSVGTMLARWPPCPPPDRGLDPGGHRDQHRLRPADHPGPFL